MGGLKVPYDIGGVDVLRSRWRQSCGQWRLELQQSLVADCERRERIQRLRQVTRLEDNHCNATDPDSSKHQQQAPSA